MAKVLITGGAGFLGSHLCDKFITEGHEVVCMDNFVTGSPSILFIELFVS
jgi:dTDP-glucose 4,6-dehydratase